MDWDKVDADPLQFLVGPQGSKGFLEEVWEQKPHVFKATPERKAFFQNLVNFKQLKALATQKEEEGDPLAFGEDINAARYVDGVRETPNGDVADAETLKDLFVREGCTMQLHQPQRFVDDLWRLMAALERQLGCLVGCNAYLTPKHTQGLAPHWDDVEIFVIQTEGSKRWSIYRPKEGPYARSALANHCSGDLEEEALGAPLMEFILEAGDVLYMPRGTIHQARALSSHSSHLTISTYQRWAWGDLMQYAVGVCLANPQLQPTLPAAVRAGLPLRWLEAAGFCRADVPPLGSRAGGHGGKGTGNKAARGGAAGGPGTQGGLEARGKLVLQLAEAFRSMADWLEAGEGEGGQVPAGERALLAASCAMSEDFMRNRLPPHPEQLPDAGPEPSGDDDVVACRGQGLFLPVPLSPDDHPDTGSDSESDEDMSGGEEENGGAHGGSRAAGAVGGAGTKWVRLLSSLGNDREGHMMSGGGGGEGEGGCEEEGGCCNVPGCEHDHAHDHHHHHEHGHGSSSDEEEEEEGNEGDSSDEGEGEEGAAAAATAAVTAAGGKKRPGSAGQKRKEREEAEAEEEEDSAEIQSGSDIEDISLDALMEGGECCGEEGVEEDIVLPIALAPALLQLLATDARAGRGMRLGDLMAGGPEVRRDLAAALWGSGVLCVLPRLTEAPALEAAEAKGEEEQGQGQEEGKGSTGKKKGKGKSERDGGGSPGSAGKKGSGGSKKAKA